MTDEEAMAACAKKVMTDEEAMAGCRPPGLMTDEEAMAACCPPRRAGWTGPMTDEEAAAGCQGPDPWHRLYEEWRRGRDALLSPDRAGRFRQGA